MTKFRYKVRKYEAGWAIIDSQNSDAVLHYESSRSKARTRASMMNMQNNGDIAVYALA